jgi:hypothetical protein
MYLVARAQVVGQPYMFKTIDGEGKLASQLQGDLEAECLALYSVDAMYGSDGTPQSAYQVSVTETVSDVAQGNLHAEADVVWSLHAKSVNIQLVTMPIGSLAAPTATT